MIAFAELSLRTAVEYYAKVANGSECIGETVLIDFIKVSGHTHLLICKIQEYF